MKIELTNHEQETIGNALINLISELAAVSGKLSTPERAQAIRDEISDLQRLLEKVYNLPTATEWHKNDINPPHGTTQKKMKEFYRVIQKSGYCKAILSQQDYDTLAEAEKEYDRVIALGYTYSSIQKIIVIR